MPAAATTRSPIAARKPRSTAAAAPTRWFDSPLGGITAVNFAVSAGADQTTGDTVSVANFENLDAAAITSALTVTGSSRRQHHHDRLRQRYHRWRRRRRRHRCRRRQRHGRPIAARKPRSTAAPATTRWCWRARPTSISAMPTRPRATPPPSPTSRTSMRRACRRGVDHGLVRGQHHHRRIGQRHDRWRRRRRRHHRRRRQRHRHLSRHRNLDRRRHRHQYAGAATPRRRSTSPTPIRPRATRPTSPVSRTSMPRRCRRGSPLTGSSGCQHHHRHVRQRYHQRRRRPRSPVRRRRRRHLHHRRFIAGARHHDQRRQLEQLGQPGGQFGHHHGHGAAGVADRTFSRSTSPRAT